MFLIFNNKNCYSSVSNYYKSQARLVFSRQCRSAGHILYGIFIPLAVKSMDRYTLCYDSAYHYSYFGSEQTFLYCYAVVSIFFLFHVIYSVFELYRELDDSDDDKDDMDFVPSASSDETISSDGECDVEGDIINEGLVDYKDDSKEKKD